MAKTKKSGPDAISVFEQVVQNMVESQVGNLEESVEQIVKKNVESMTKNDLEEIVKELKEYVDQTVAKTTKEHLVALSTLIIEKFQPKGE